MKATLGDIYLCRTANMSWRTCVVVKQIQSNPIHCTKFRIQCESLLFFWKLNTGLKTSKLIEQQKSSSKVVFPIPSKYIENKVYIMNCGQHQWAIPSLFSIVLYALLEKNITRKLLSLSLDLFFKILLFQVTFLIFFSTAIFSPYFLQVGLLLQHVALFQSGN